jgi:hypothetical protein
MVGLSDISFDPRLKFGNQISQRFGCSVSLIPSQLSSSFKLVASFGRSAIRLNEDLVGLLLQSCLGGCSSDFHVKHLSGWMFSFHVSCKKVGFMIKNLGTFSCRMFAIFFYLWGNGGPNWLREFQLWIDEQNVEWTIVSRKPGNSHNHSKGQSAMKSYADIVKSIPPTRTSVFKRLHYPKNYADAFLGNNHNRVFSSSEESHFRRSSNSNSLAQSHHSRPPSVWKPIPRANFQAPHKETLTLLDPNKPACGPLNRCPRCLGLGHH